MRRRGKPAAVPPPNEDRLDRIERVLEGLGGAFSRGNDGNGQGNVPPPIVAQPHPDLSMREFQRLKPSTFDGGISAQQLQNWILGLEGIFEVEPCSETHKVVLATFMLQGEARRWWLMKKDSEPNITWTRFKEVLDNKYFPSSVRNSKCAEFIALKQDDMSIEDYNIRFTELSQYATHMVATPDLKARKFEDGLHEDLQLAVKLQKLPTQDEVFDRALMAEESVGKSKRKASLDREEFQTKSSNKKQERESMGSGSSGENNNRTRECPHCSRWHKGVFF